MTVKDFILLYNYCITNKNLSVDHNQLSCTSQATAMTQLVIFLLAVLAFGLARVSYNSCSPAIYLLHKNYLTPATLTAPLKTFISDQGDLSW